MAPSESPLNRSIGLAGVIRWLIVVALVLTVGAAAADGYYAMASVVALFGVLAAYLAYRGWRAKRAATLGESPHERI